MTHYSFVAGGLFGAIMWGHPVAIVAFAGLFFIATYVYTFCLKPSKENNDWLTDVSICVIALHAKMAKSDGVVSASEIRLFRDVSSFSEMDEPVVSALYNSFRRDADDYEHYAQRLMDLTVLRPDVRQIVLDGLCFVALAEGSADHFDRYYYPYLSVVAARFGFGKAYLDESLHKMQDALRTGAGYSRDQHYNAGQGASAVGDVVKSFRILGVEEDATSADVKKAYRKLMQKLHPDKLVARDASADERAHAADELLKVQEAYDVLKKHLN